MEATAKAYQDWKADEGARRQALRDAAARILSSSSELAPILTAEQGKPLSDANLEIFAAGMWLQYYADLDLPREIIQDYHLAFVEVVRKPLGVVVAITPWNFPWPAGRSPPPCWPAATSSTAPGTSSSRRSLADVGDGTRIVDEEQFGPALPVVSYETSTTPSGEPKPPTSD